jgi:hypothetical protein
MSQDIAQFYATASKKDFARQFQFRLTQLGAISFSTGTTSKNNTDEVDALVYVETANLPGRTINAVQVPFMGLQFNVPGTASYPGSNSYAVTFRCDQAYDIRSALEKYTRETFDDITSTGDFSIPGFNGRRGANSSNTIIFSLYDKAGGKLFDYNLYGAFVVNLADASYNIGDGGAIVQVQATLAYQFWTKTKVGSGTQKTEIKRFFE